LEIDSTSGYALVAHVSASGHAWMDAGMVVGDAVLPVSRNWMGGNAVEEGQSMGAAAGQICLK
jgi:hypothetical protein